MHNCHCPAVLACEGPCPCPVLSVMNIATEPDSLIPLVLPYVMTSLISAVMSVLYCTVYAALTALVPGVHDSEVTMTSLDTIVSAQHYILYRHCHNRSIVLYCTVLLSIQPK